MKRQNLKIALSCLPLIWALPSFAICKSSQAIPASTPTAQFSDNGNGTITDNKTGLMWSKCVVGKSGSNCSSGNASSYNWNSALSIASSSSHANYTDWRLPNVKELRSIIEEQCYNPSINTSIFPGTPGSSFWTASPNMSSSFFTYYVSFYYGITGSNFRTSALPIRLVRAGF